MVDSRLAIVVDDEVLIAPVVKEAIPDGKAHIALGMVAPGEAEAQATALAATLNAGSLPAPLEIEAVKQVGLATGSGGG